METSEFDKIIRERVKQDNSLFEQEMKQAKPLVWSEIERELNPNLLLIRKSYLVAAVILLLLGTSSLFYYNQIQYTNEINQFALELNKIKEIYEGQNTALIIKSNELACLQQELTQLDEQVDLYKNSSTENLKPIYVYRRDTVVVKQIEYLQKQEVPLAEKLDSIKVQDNITEKLKTENELDTRSDAIYPSFNTTSKVKHEMNSLKIKVNALVAN